MASPFETYMKKTKRNNALANVRRSALMGGGTIYDKKAEKEKIEQEYLSNIQPTATAEFSIKENPAREAKRNRRQNAIQDNKILQEAMIMNEFDKARNLGGDIGVKEIRKIGMSQPGAQSIFNRMYKDDGITFSELTRENKQVMPYKPSDTDMMQMENLIRKNGMMPGDIKANPAMAKVFNSSRRLQDLAQVNVDKMLKAEEDQIASDNRDKRYKQDKAMEEAAYQDMVREGPKIGRYYGPGVDQDRMNLLAQDYVKYGETGTPEAMVQGLMGADGIEDGLGLIGMLNMRRELKKAGASEDQLSAYDDAGHRARIDKMDREYERDFGPKKNLQQLLADRDERKMYESMQPVKLKNPPMPKGQQVPPFVEAAKLKGQLAGIKLAKKGKKAGQSLMAGLSGKYTKNLDRKINAQEGGGFFDLLKQKAGDVVQAGSDAYKGASDAVGGAVKATGNFLDNRYGDQAVKNRQADSEAYGQLSQMEGWDSMDEATQQKLVNQRVQGLSDNEMYGQGEDQVDISGGEGLTKAGAIAGDVAKGIGVGALGGVGLAGAGLYEGGKALLKGGKGLYDKATADDGFLGGERASYEDFASGKSRGSFLQRLGKGMVGAGNFVDKLNEDIPFSSVKSDIQFQTGKGSKGKVPTMKNDGYTNEFNVESGGTQDTQVSSDVNAIAKGEDATVKTDKGEIIPSVILSKAKSMDDLKNMDPEMLKTFQASLAKSGYDMSKSATGEGGYDGKFGPETQAAFQAYLDNENAGGIIQQENTIEATPPPPPPDAVYDDRTMQPDLQGFKKGGFISELMQYQRGGLV
tara:strand:+ start:1724 stop:4138 length:2415 start_codon:yes stop_codon:yes gene_type:complete